MSNDSHSPSAFEVHEAPTQRQRGALARPGPADLMVLVVDDDADIRALYCAWLDNMGYRTTGCGDCREALAQMMRKHSDVVLMDMSMPDVDGIEGTRLLKAEAPETFIIGMSGAAEQYFDQARASGCEAFLRKPFNPYLVEDILGALTRSKGRELVKRCGCGREHTRAGWKALRLCGEMGDVELRNCVCGSSLALGDRTADS
jgi:CheY-like chemotaxis protein